jgi:hypothetical protein
MLKMPEWETVEEKYVVRSYTMCNPSQILLENDMGWACNTRGKEEE